MTIHTKSISCLSYNIHKGFSADNRTYLLSEMRDAIRSTGADIVAIQEILGEHRSHAMRHPNWHTEAHFEFLADRVWTNYAYGKNAIYQNGHHGNAILSKHPFLSKKNHDITQWRFSQRGLLHGVLAITRPNNSIVHAACVHLGFLPFEQWRQTRKLIQWVEQLPPQEPMILMGDFNDWHYRIHKTLTQRLQLKEVGTEFFGAPQHTFPSSKPRLALDRIYYRGLKLDQVEVLSGKAWSELSDHNPIWAKFLLEF